MGRSLGSGESPPQQGHARAGITGVAPMVTFRTRLIHIGFLFGLLAVLAYGTSLEPSQALARPVGTGGPVGEPYSGDPTGDDHPSPTPKPAPRAVGKLGVEGKGKHVLTMRHRGFDSTGRWSLYFRILVRLGIR
jgi:hypothetical protein